MAEPVGDMWGKVNERWEGRLKSGWPVFVEGIESNSHPDDVDCCGRICAVPAAVNYEADSPDDVEQLVGLRSRIQPPGGQQRVREKDENGADPSGGFDEYMVHVVPAVVRTEPSYLTVWCSRTVSHSSTSPWQLR